MGDLGAGAASGYPGALDTNPSPEDGTGSTTHNPGEGAINACIAIQTELGTDPAGSLNNVKTFLQTEHNTDGTHKFIKGSTTWNPGSIANGAEESQDVTVTGAALGDFALGSFSVDTADMSISASVTATNTVTVSLLNNTGGAIDLVNATVRAIVIKDY